MGTRWLSRALVVGIFGAVAACASAPQPGPPRLTGYLAKGEQCAAVAELAGAAVVIKTKVRSGELRVGNGTKPETVVGFVISRDAETLGWSHENTLAFAREICDAAPYRNLAAEILGANLYFRTACKLETAATPVRPYATLTPRIEACLASPDPEAQRTCAEAAIR
jgi:hypothetical protein